VLAIPVPGPSRFSTSPLGFGWRALRFSVGVLVAAVAVAGDGEARTGVRKVGEWEKDRVRLKR
jgi:hypothetical protein